MTTKEQIKQIRRWNKLYREGQPEVSDQVYDDYLDSLEDKLTTQAYAALRRSLLESKGKVKHNTIIGSLRKVKAENPDELLSWAAKESLIGEACFEMAKIDGASITLTYAKGLLVSAVTRGDGEFGEDQTDKFQYVCPTCKGEFTGEIRAEVTLTYDSFEILKEMDPKAKNLRNSTVGLLNNDSIYPKKLDLLMVVAYQIISGEGHDIAREKQIAQLETMGFDVPQYSVIYPDNEKDVKVMAGLLTMWKETSPYQVDGIVICGAEYVGENSMLPEGMVAFKLRSDEAETPVKDIEWNVSKSGDLRPVIILEPTELDGTTVQRASGYNYDKINELRLCYGDIVSVHKGGEIIPVVEEVLERKGGKLIVPPCTCPECNGPVNPVGVHLRCENAGCTAQTLKTTEAFLGKLGVMGASRVSLKKWGIVSIDDLVDWKPNAKYSMETKFYANMVEKVFTAPYVQLIGCMGWDGVGRRTIKKCIDFYGVDRFKQICFDERYPKFEYDYPEGISKRTLTKIFRHWEHNDQMARDIMEDARYNEVIEEETATGDRFAGKSFCFTGKISKPRKFYEQFVKDNGGEIKSVSKNLDYLVVGEKAGGKKAKAEKLGVKTISEAEFNGMA